MFSFKKKTTKFSDFRMNYSSKFYVPPKYRETKKTTVQEKISYNKDLLGFNFYSAIFQAFFDNGFDASCTPLHYLLKSQINGKITSTIYNNFDQNLNERITQVFSILSLIKKFIKRLLNLS